MPTMRYYCTSLLLLVTLSYLVPRHAAAQAAAATRTTYYDAARTQRRAVFGTVLRGSRPDTVPHGPYRRYWRTGSLAEVGHFTQGQADSTWTRYYPAAPGRPPAVARRLAMRAGQPDGSFVVWHPNGRLAQRGTFRQGQLFDSVVSRTAAGQPRLLAHFARPATDSTRLTGSFRQWRSDYTAPPLTFKWSPRPDHSFDNPYPARDSARYWTGQLANGHLTGILTEKDADGQLRVRLVFNAAGQVQLVTQYYPAAWLRYEAKQGYYNADDSLPRSQPLWQWQAVGSQPYLLLQHWSVIGGKTQRLLHAVGSSRHPGPPRCGLAAAPALVEVGALTRLAVHGAAWAQPYTGRPVVPKLPAPPSPAQPTRRVLPPALVPLGQPSPWLLGTIDTLTGAYTLAHERITTAASGARTVETLHATREYRADGSLESEERTLRSGIVVSREYYANGHLESRVRTYPGADDKRQSRRTWAENGQLQAAGRVHRNGHIYGRSRDKNDHLPLFNARLDQRPRRKKPRRAALKKHSHKKVKHSPRTH